MKLTAKQYANILYLITEGKDEKSSREAISKFVSFLERGKKLKLVPKILSHFERIFEDKHEEITVEATFARSAGEEEKKLVRNFIKQRFPKKKVNVRSFVDPKIKGGIIMKIRDDLYDVSLQRKLLILKKAISGIIS